MKQLSSKPFLLLLILSLSANASVTAVTHFVHKDTTSAGYYKKSDSLFLYVHDADENISGSMYDTIRLEISSTTESEGEVVKLTETGFNTGIFFGMMLFDTLNPVAVDGKLKVVNGDYVYLSYIDTANDFGNQQELRDTAVYGNVWNGSLTFGTHTYWYSSENPYLIFDSLLVGYSCTLTVNPGVVVKFIDGTGAKLLVKGKLQVGGTAADSVRFTSSAAGAAAGDWRYIKLLNDVQASFQYATFDYCSSAVLIDTLYSGFSIQLRHVRISNTATHGIWYKSIYSPSASAYQISVDSCLFYGSGTNNAVYWYTPSGSGVAAPWAQFSDNRIDNWAKGFAFENFSGGTNNRFRIYRNKVTNSSIGIAGVIPNTTTSYYVDIKHDTLYVAQSGIYLQGPCDSIAIDSNIIQGPGGSGTGISISGTIYAIRYNTVTNFSRAIYYTNASKELLVTRNNLYNCSWGVYNNTSYGIDARYNYWGSAATTEMDGGGNPKNITVIYDYHDNSSKGAVNYSTWLSAENGSPTPVSSSAQGFFSDKYANQRSFFKKNDTLYVYIKDSDENLNGSVYDTIRVNVSSTTESSGEVIKLAETGLDSGSFIGSILFDTLNPVAADGKLKVVNGDYVYLSYIDTTNDFGNQQEFRDTAVYGNVWNGSLTFGTHTYWYSSENPYLIFDSLLVGYSCTLTINPGVVVKFIDGTGAKLLVKGKLQVGGTAADSVRFTSSAAGAAAGDWRYIKLLNDVQASFQYATFDYCSSAVLIDTLYSGFSIQLRHVRISNTATHGIWYKSIYSPSASAYQISVDSCLFYGSGTNNAVYWYTPSGSGAAAPWAQFSDNRIDNWNQGFVFENFSGGTNNRFRMYRNKVINCAEGIRIVVPNNYTSYDVDIIYDTLQVSQNGIYLQGRCDSVIIDSNIIQGQGGSGTGIYLMGTIDTISFNTITGFEKAVYYTNASKEFLLIRNNLYNCSWGVYNNTSYGIDARYNYWGSAATTEMDGGGNPKNITVIYDYHDNSSKGAVNYSTWLSAENGSPTPVSSSAQGFFSDKYANQRSFFKKNDTLYVYIKDSDENLNGSVYDTIRVNVSSTTESSGEVIKLAETGLDSGSFIGSILFDTLNPVAVDGKLKVVNGDYVYLSYIDTTNDFGNQQEFRDTAVYGNVWNGSLTFGTHTYWYSSENPYLIFDSLLVGYSCTLTINPGVVVKFIDGTGAKLLVKGKLQVGGTAADSVRFISSAAAPAAGDWRYIKLLNDVQASFQYATFDYCSSAVLIDTLYSGFSIQLRHVRISNTATHGIWYKSIYSPSASAYQISVDSCLFYGSGTNNAVYWYTPSGSGVAAPWAQFSDNRIDNWNQGFVFENFSGGTNNKFRLYRNKVTNCTKGIMLLLSGSSNGYYADIQYDTLTVSHTGIYSQGKSDSIFIKHNVIQGTQSSAMGINFFYGSADTIAYNSITDFSYAVYYTGVANANLYQNNLFNCTYNFYNNSSYSVAAKYNYWGSTATSEMNNGSNPKNITRIYDYYDNNTRGMVNYASWLSTANGAFAPSFQSTPDSLIQVNKPYTYQVQAYDPNNETITYTLVTAPAGMTIGSSTGLVQWTAGPEGSYTVKIGASDGTLTSYQQYNLRVYPDSIAPDNDMTLTATAQETSIALSWNPSAIDSTDADSIGIWYSTSAYPSSAHDASATGSVILPLSSSSHTLTGLSPASTYYFVLSVRDTSGNWAAISNTGKASAVPIGVAPAITTQPQDITVITGQTATLSITASGTAALTYKWIKDSTDTVGSSSTLTFDTASTNHAGKYFCTVKNAYGAATSNSVTVTVLVPPKAAFTASSVTGIDSATIRFTDSSTGDISRWIWSYGDGRIDSFTTQTNPTHVYLAPGKYTVMLALSGPAGRDTLTKSNFITIYQKSVSSFHGTPTSGIDTQQVQFSLDSISTGVSRWYWFYGDGTSDTFTTAINPVHTYKTTGVFSVMLKVNGLGGSDSMIRSDYIRIYQKVHASFAADKITGEAPLVVHFSDSSRGDISSWKWTFGDTTTDTVRNPKHTFNTRGNYNVSLIVTGNGGNDTALRQNYITVINSPPVLTLPSSVSIYEDSSWNLAVSVQDANNDTVTLSFISAPSSVTVSQQTKTVSWVPSNNDVGLHSIIIKANDGHGGYDTASIAVTVINTNDYPVIAGVSLPDTIYEDSSFSGWIDVSDEDKYDTVALSSVPLLSWISMKKAPVTGSDSLWRFTLSGTPLNKDTGWHHITFTAKDSGGLTATMKRSLYVVNTNDAPETYLKQKHVAYGASRYILEAVDDFDSVCTFFVSLRGIGNSYTKIDSNRTGLFPYHPLADGMYLFVGYAMDNEGLKDPTPLIDTLVIKGATVHTWSDTGVWTMASIPTQSYDPTALKSTGTIAHWDESLPPNGIYKYYQRAQNIITMNAGKSYWIKLQKPIEARLTQDLLHADSSTVSLYKTEYGWNQIASPYPYPVKWPKTYTLWEWDPQLRDFVESDGILYPWHGYWVLADSSETISISTKPSFIKRTAARHKRTSLINRTEWTFNVALTTNSNSDADNLFGLSKHAHNEYDPLDRPEPPRLGNEPYLFFAHPEWKRPVDEFASDIRHTWQGVNIYQAGISACTKDITSMNLSISGLTENMPFYIFIKTLEQITEYKPGTSISIKPMEQRQYCTIFATEDKNFLKHFPFVFAMNNPYPNPCRPAARIRYTLPYRWQPNGWLDTSPYEVRMNIYDMRGRVIRELVHSKQGPGHYTVIWHGKGDTGRPVASGTYICRLVAGKYQSVKRIISIR